MAYFLKISDQTPSKGKYLQIYESFWDKSIKRAKNKSFKKIGYVNDLISDKIPDPITYWKNEVKKLNEKKAKEESDNAVKLISVSPEKNIGYLLQKHIYNTLAPENLLAILANEKKFQFDISRLIEALIYARCVNPCSKFKTYEEVIPYLYENYDFSLDQIYEGLEFIGFNYEKIIEIFNESYTTIVKKRNTSKVYFDCTNFYFEIDKEDDFRKKGASKEKRSEPIVGLGLLLDSQQIPLTMKVFPGSDSEKPVIREVIQEMKKRYNISGKTIQVADKGLNCAKNIYECMSNHDGYIYSQSVKMLSQTEKKWVRNKNNEMTKVFDKSGNIAYEYKECVDDFMYDFNTDNGKFKFKVKQKRILTFNEKLRDKQVCEINKLVEKAKNFSSSKIKKNEYGDCAKYVNSAALTEDGEVIKSNITFINTDKVNEDLELAGFNLLVTSEIDAPASEIYTTYHNLWKIEESFRIMKSQLDARPVYVHKVNSIKGHFLICYLSVFLLRINQYLRFKNELCANQLCDFIKTMRVLKLDDNSDKVINLTTSNETITTITKKTNLPFNNFFIKTDTLNKMISYKLKRKQG